MLRFQPRRTTQKFVSVHASVFNHFNAERHLYSRLNFKTNRDAAIAEWRALLASGQIALTGKPGRIAYLPNPFHLMQGHLIRSVTNTTFEHKAPRRNI